jgi:hypothetical protein
VGGEQADCEKPNETQHERDGRIDCANHVLLRTDLRQSAAGDCECGQKEQP